MSWRDFLPPILTKAFTWNRTLGIFSLRGPTWSNTVAYETLIREGFTNAVVFACVMEIARAAAGVPWMIKQRPSSRAGRTQLVPEDHPAWTPLRRANPWQSGTAFREAMVAHYMLAGNVFCLRVSTVSRGREVPKELYLLLPDKARFKALYDAQYQRVGYAYTEYTPTGQQLPLKLYASGTLPEKATLSYQNITRVPDGHVLHLTHFTPTMDWYGFSPMLAAAHSVDNLNAALAWNTALLQQFCRPSVVITYEQRPDEADVVAMRQQLDEAGGPSAAGRPFILYGGLRVDKLGLAPNEMDWLEGKTDAGLDICRAFNVAPELIGFSGAKTYANYETARKALYTETVFPILTMIAEELSTWLLPRYDDGLFLTIDRDSVEAVRTERMRLFAELSKPGAWWLTRNQKLGLVGLPVEGPEHDILLVPDNLVPVGLSSEAATPLGRQSMPLHFPVVADTGVNEHGG